MKKLLKVFTILILLVVVGQSSLAQNKKNNWILVVEVNAVDVYPVGEDDPPQGPYFDEFFNIADHWNIGIPKITVSKYFTDHIYLSLSGSYNNLKKWGEFQDVPSARVDNLTYIGVDGMFNFYFSRLSNFNKLQPFVGVGGGYTWIEQGQINTLSGGISNNNLVGAGTVNGALGANYWINDRIGLNLQTMYKHSFEDYLTKHWQHSFGVIVVLAKSDIKKKEEEDTGDRDGDGILDSFDKCPDEPGSVQLDGCPDSDGDGIADKDDLCPEIYGLEIYDGCVDSDGDGYADNVDDCPEIKGTLKGCPEENEEPVPVSIYCFEDLEDMNAYYASLNRDGRKEVEGLTFKIQVGAYRRQIEVSYFDFLKDVGPIEEIQEEDLNKFRFGNYATLLETETMRQNVIEQGVTDAFVLAFYHNTPISMEEAIALLCTND